MSFNNITSGETPKCVTQSNYNFLTEMLAEKSGLALSDGKSYLVETRLGPLAEKYGCDSIDSLIDMMRSNITPGLQTEVAETMATYESYFFRDGRPFEQLREMIIPELKKRNSNTKTIRIWCGASSTGQEPYSIAILLSELQPSMPDWKFEIVASDFSNVAINQSRTGIYTQFEVQRGLPIQYLVKYFKQIENNRWQINDDIKRKVDFRHHNLLHEPNYGRFDVIFCRNVLIYFDPHNKGIALEFLAKSLNREGYLFLGGSETVVGLSNSFSMVDGQRGVYQVIAKS